MFPWGDGQLGHQAVVDLAIMAVYNDRKALARDSTWPGQQRKFILASADVFLSLGLAAKPQEFWTVRLSAAGEVTVAGVPVRLDTTLEPETIKLVGEDELAESRTVTLR